MVKQMTTPNKLIAAVGSTLLAALITGGVAWAHEIDRSVTQLQTQNAAVTESLKRLDAKLDHLEAKLDAFKQDFDRQANGWRY